jgi:hypothetical protein
MGIEILDTGRFSPAESASSLCRCFPDQLPENAYRKWVALQRLNGAARCSASRVASAQRTRTASRTREHGSGHDCGRLWGSEWTRSLAPQWRSKERYDIVANIPDGAT